MQQNSGAFFACAAVSLIGTISLCPAIRPSPFSALPPGCIFCFDASSSRNFLQFFQDPSGQCMYRHCGDEDYQNFRGQKQENSFLHWSGMVLPASSAHK